MSELYPLKFSPIYKNKIWGGNKFKTVLHRTDAPDGNCGESWEISGIEDDCSVVSNGFLKGNTLTELIDIYMDELVGDKVFDTYNNLFPLLIKFLDVTDLLSVQVHPNDELALIRHNSYGKTEMWYIAEADKNADLTIGFNRAVDRDIFIEHYAEGKIQDLLNQQTVSKDEVYFIPAGRIHSAGHGLLIAEIQQTSDITYRIFDWNRVEPDGTSRELHVDLALDALDFKPVKEYKTPYKNESNKTTNVVSCEYFRTNIINFDAPVVKDYSHIDSFVIYMCLEGNVRIQYGAKEPEIIQKGETVLIPASIDRLTLKPLILSKLIEIYVP